MLGKILKQTILWIMVYMTVLIGSALADTANTYFEIDASGTITSYRGSAEELTIPQSINGTIVKAIGEYAFENCRSLVRVTIPEGVSTIGERAFSGCRGLEEVVFPESLCQIGDYAFYNCHYIKRLNIPDNGVTIGKEAFSGKMFGAVDGSGYYELGKNIKGYVVGSDAIISGSGEYMYEKDTVEWYRYMIVNNWDIWGCEVMASAKRLILEQGITSIPEMEPYVGVEWTNLEEVIIPETVTRIENHAFAVCPALRELIIPETVTYIGETAFDGCSALTVRVYRNSYAHTWCVENDVRFKCIDHAEVIDAAVPPTCFTPGYTEGKHCSVCGEVILAQNEIPMIEVKVNIVLPKAVTVICEQAFADVPFECVIIPEGCVTIAAGAFEGNGLLKFIEIPASVEQIDITAFKDCGEDLIIITTAGSAAETFAIENSIRCVLK